jgi:hypothetical protein
VKSEKFHLNLHLTFAPNLPSSLWLNIGIWVLDLPTLDSGNAAIPGTDRLLHAERHGDSLKPDAQFCSGAKLLPASSQI